jgi:hypothetical protein
MEVVIVLMLNYIPSPVALSILATTSELRMAWQAVGYF